MEAFTSLTAVAAPLMRANIDTDAIIPSREMTAVSKSGLAAGLFANWRYRHSRTREPEPTFILNQSEFSAAEILLTGENFGCGSSREHAVWALHDYGIRAIVAPSFAPIFFGNCVRNGIAPAIVQGHWLAQLAQRVLSDPERYRVTVDVRREQVSAPELGAHPIIMPAEVREILMSGHDPVDMAVRRLPEVAAFVERDRIARAWVYLNDTPRGVRGN
ncbi:MAG: 3-isopropylmalate dehydratase small subunit [Steroidobacteraceae bacterium]